MGTVSHGARNRLAMLCVFLGCVLSLVAMTSGWVREETMNTNRWVTTSSRLFENHDIQSAVAQKLADQIADSNAAARMVDAAKSYGGANLSTASIRKTAQTAVIRVLRSPTAQALWVAANRSAQRLLVYIINDDGSTKNGLSLNLGPIVDRAVAGAGLHISLPAGAGEVQVFDSPQLGTVRTAAKILKRVAVGSLVLTVVLLLGAILIAHDRLRTLRRTGIGLVLTGILVIVLRLLGVELGTGALSAGGNDSSAVHATLMIASGLWVEIAELVAISGAALAVGSWVLGLAARGLRQSRTVDIRLQ